MEIFIVSREVFLVHFAEIKMNILVPFQFFNF